MADLVPFAEDQSHQGFRLPQILTYVVLTDKGVSRPHFILFMGANGTCSTPTIVLIQQQCRRMVSFEVAQLWRGTRTCTDTSVDILHESADNHIQEIDPNHQKKIPQEPGATMSTSNHCRRLCHSRHEQRTPSRVEMPHVASCGFVIPWIDPLPKCSTARHREPCRSEHWKVFVNVGGVSWQLKARVRQALTECTDKT